MMLFLAQLAGQSALSGWWDIAQKIGSGAAFVLGVVVIYLWRAYIGEVKYSKDRDTQMLTVLLRLTTLIEGIEKRDMEALARHERTAETLGKAIADLRGMIEGREQRRKG